jgi:hypothetical protein
LRRVQSTGCSARRHKFAGQAAWLARNGVPCITLMKRTILELTKE